jgi:hypothetical protein
MIVRDGRIDEGDNGMVRQTIAILTMTAIANLIVGGCSKVVNMRLDEVGVDTPKRITGVVAKSGQDVTFDQKGGEYDPSHKHIAGTTSDGRRLNKWLKDLDTVRVASSVDSAFTPNSIAAGRFHEYCRPKVDNILSVETRQSMVHKFWSGGRIDRSRRLVEGLSISGTTLRIPFDSIAYIGVKKTDWVKTGIFIGVSTALLTAAVFAAASAVIEGLNETAWLY